MQVPSTKYPNSFALGPAWPRAHRPISKWQQGAATPKCQSAPTPKTNTKTDETNTQVDAAFAHPTAQTIGAVGLATLP